MNMLNQIILEGEIKNVELRAENDLYILKVESIMQIQGKEKVNVFECKMPDDLFNKKIEVGAKVRILGRLNCSDWVTSNDIKLSKVFISVEFIEVKEN